MRDADALTTLDVFDEQLVVAASELVRGRLRLVERLAPAVDAAYRALAGMGEQVTAAYEADWAGGAVAAGDAPADIAGRLRGALTARRRQEIDRGLTLVGPHRDEWKLSIDELDARTQASQGEQRTLALAMRLAGHAVVTELTDTAPVLLLDDVFSELDASRSHALVRNLPAGQTLLTTASAIPDEIVADRRLRIHEGRVEDAT
jgi:DNA replication and repair protein RecF